MAFIPCFQRILNAVERANVRKGYGSVKNMKMSMDGSLEIIVSRPHCRDCTRHGRINNGRVYFAGTSAKIV